MSTKPKRRKSKKNLSSIIEEAGRSGHKLDVKVGNHGARSRPQSSLIKPSMRRLDKKLKAATGIPDSPPHLKEQFARLRNTIDAMRLSPSDAVELSRSLQRFYSGQVIAGMDLSKSENIPDIVLQPGKSKGSKKRPPPIPKKAPELWSDRDRAKSENPAAFTRRVYAKWIGHGLTKPHIHDLDKPLYRALSVWAHRHPEDKIVELAPITDPVDKMLERLGDEFTDDELRRLGLALQSRMRRKAEK